MVLLVFGRNNNLNLLRAEIDLISNKKETQEVNSVDKRIQNDCKV